jgi:valyl-tRNA synthetase
MEVFGGFQDEYFDKGKGRIEGGLNKDLSYYYPTQVLVTAPEILFFWVARMIIAGYEYMDEKPFEDVYLTGIVRDKQGRKMSKSLGNSPDPLELIARYGADGVRTGMLFSSPAGNDLLFDEKLCEQGRNFANKIWNAFRLVKGWEVVELKQPEENALAVTWFDARLNEALGELEDNFKKFRISDALMTNYKLVWDDFCSWYLEIIKPEYGSPIDKVTNDQTIKFFQTVLKLLHPFMPFITEELWHQLSEREETDCIIISKWPRASEYDSKIIKKAASTFEVITQIRNVRSAKGISPKESLKLIISETGKSIFEPLLPITGKLGNLSDITFGNNKNGTGSVFVINSVEFTVPLDGNVDVNQERESIRQELEYARGFLNSVMKKLGNEKFVSGAPAHVIEIEYKKKADAEAKIKTLEASLKSLGD